MRTVGWMWLLILGIGAVLFAAAALIERPWTWAAAPACVPLADMGECK